VSCWIESHTTMRTHKKLKPLCDLLGVSRPTAIGHLHLLWWWAIENREDGDLSGLFDHDIAVACDWSGSPEVLIKALHDTGWLQNYRIKDWEDYSHRLLHMRKSNRERQKRHRNEAVTRDVTGYVPPATVPNLTKQYKERVAFQAPTLETVLSEIPDRTTAEEFHDYYQSKGWVVGRSPMKDWRAAARRWMRNKDGFKPKAKNDNFPGQHYALPEQS